MKIEGNNSLFNFKRAFPTSRIINQEQLFLELSTPSSTVLQNLTVTQFVQKFTTFYTYLKVHYSVHSSLLVGPLISQTKPAPSFIFHFLKNHINIFPPSMHMHPNSFLAYSMQAHERVRLRVHAPPTSSSLTVCKENE